MSDFVSDLEYELRAASTRRIRLAVARAPFPPATAVAVVLSVAVCIAVAGVALTVHAGPGASRPGASNPKPPITARVPPARVHDPVVRDCLKHGSLTGRYTAAQLRHALTAMPAAVRKYTNCTHEITAALLAKETGKRAPLTPAPVQSIPPSLQHAFAVFRHARVPADALPSGYVRPALRDGANPSLSRFVLSTTAFQGAGPTKDWLVPAAGQLCAVEKEGSGGGISCTQDSVAVQRGVVNGIVGPKNGILFGVLPEGARDVKLIHADGSSVPVKVTSTGAFVVRSSLPATLSYIQPNGTRATDPLQAAKPNHMNPKACRHTTPLC